MIDWREQGILLAMRRHGETSAIIEVLTRDHGRHAGVVRGGGGRKMAPVLQPGAQLDVAWRARLSDHIGSFTVEPIRARAPLILSDRRALAGLSAVTALLAYLLPERAAYPRLYDQSHALLDLMVENDAWPYGYLLWEMALLGEMGVGLDLSACAVTGRTDGLAYVSPKTGRAVSREGAGEWASKLLPLPRCMQAQGYDDPSEISQALETTGYFLKHKLTPQLDHKPFPEARQRLLDVL